MLARVYPVTRMSPRGVVAKARTVFQKHPLLCNCLSYGFLITASEAGQQTIIYKIMTDNPRQLDTGTIARYAVMGTLVLPNIMYRWYR